MWRKRRISSDDSYTPDGELDSEPGESFINTRSLRSLRSSSLPLDRLKSINNGPQKTPSTTQTPIKNEANKSLPNKRGSIAMARTSDPHSASAQFFINVVDNDFLNFTSESTNGWGYCVFGKVTEGMDVVDKIKKVPTTTKSGHQNVPVDNVMIENVTVKE